MVEVTVTVMLEAMQENQVVIVLVPIIIQHQVDPLEVDSNQPMFLPVLIAAFYVQTRATTMLYQRITQKMVLLFHRTMQRILTKHATIITALAEIRIHIQE